MARTVSLDVGALWDSNRPLPAWWVWLLGFVYTILVGGIIQLALLPGLFPAWVTGDGLLKSTDSVAYHAMALAMVDEIRNHGWSAWQLAPRSQFSAGFTALFYGLFTSRPWVMLPVNAGAHALCFAVLYHIAFRFLPDWRLALLSACPYLLFPSSAMWYSQLLKDGYFNAGILLFVVGWVALANHRIWVRARSRIVLWAIAILAGYLLMSLIRAYMFAVLVTLTWMLVFVVGGFVRVKTRNGPDSRRTATLLVITMASILIGTVTIRHVLVQVGYVTTKTIFVESRLDRLTSRPDATGVKQYWEESPWLFKAIDRRVATLAGIRDGYLNSGKNPKSLIDTDVTFGKMSDVLFYLPRAAQIALLSPFPDMWMGQGSTGATTMMRRVSMLEMSATYLALLFLPFAIWHWRKRGELWVIVSTSMSIMLLYAVTTPNIGTLYRVRYGYLMLLITLGLAGAGALWSRRAAKGP